MRIGSYVHGHAREWGVYEGGSGSLDRGSLGHGETFINLVGISRGAAWKTSSYQHRSVEENQLRSALAETQRIVQNRMETPADTRT